MRSFHMPVLLVGLVLGVCILLLVRRDHLYIRQGLFWIAIAAFSFALGLWPRLIDRIGALFGIAYPPTLLLLGAIIVLIVKALLADIALTKMRRDLRRLNQHIALLEADLPLSGSRAEPPE